MNQTLYHKGRKGAIYSWRVWTEGNEIVTEHGQVDGQKQQSRKKAIAKNEGKSNYINAVDQAMIEAKAMHKFKLDRKYSLTPEEAQEPLMLPMLAQTYSEKKHGKGPFLAQPKLDGVRCIAKWVDDEIVLMSRQGKPWDVQHIKDALKTILPKDCVFDGEIYAHGVPFQTLASWVKKPKPESKQLQYWVYDMPVVRGDEELTFKKRYMNLTEVFLRRESIMSPQF